MKKPRTQAPLNRAEREAARLPPLLVAAERIASSVALGIHGRRRAGSGEDFWQFRPYRPGDSTSGIDWRRSGRADHLFLREREWEAAQTVWLGCDQSPAMTFASTPALPTKADRAAVLCLALASMLVRGGERVALAGRDRKPIQGRTALLSMVNGLAAPQPPTLADIWAAPLAPHARMIVFSDFLDSLDSLRGGLRRLADTGVIGHLVEVADPAEETFPFEGRIRFLDAEKKNAVLIDHADSVRERYLQRRNAHRDALTQLAARHGWTVLRHRTDQPPRLALLALFLSLSEPSAPGGPVRRRG